MDGRTTISHTTIKHPADTAIISALNGIDPNKMLPFYTKASSRERTCIPPVCIIFTHHLKDQARLLSKIETTSVSEDWKFGTNRLWNSSRTLLITKQQYPPLKLIKRNNRYIIERQFVYISVCFWCKGRVILRHEQAKSINKACLSE